GGDEFVVVLPDYDNREDKNVLLSNLLQSISMPIHSATGVIEVSGSLGMTFYPQAESVDADHLIRQADVAMYQAKMQGKNRYAVFDVQKEQEQKSSQMLMVQLHSALVGDEFRVVYQPKVNMVNGAVVGVEALLRWQHPSQGLLAPEEFMSAVAEGNLVVAIDHWVIEHVVGQLQDWRRIGLDFTLSINVSIKTLEEPDFSHWLASLLLKYPGVDASKIILEVLESSAVEDVDQISLVIRASKQLGVSFSLDDFGTGYSTLNFLKKLPADELKIDRTFVRDMLHDEDDLAIIKGVLGLALAFDKKVVAEGVESEEHGLALLKLGCEQAQGYVIAKPMSAQDLVLWVRSWQPFKSWTAYSSHEQEHSVLDNH
ncbi:MAG: bifunctional diguanylate cyclase/phosphodiesterase, partial [Pseudomonadales bacterium]|nr:bifunctional diguanylate cyclase/phosphodiesterase [Pseudomonadales bacterium]